MVDKINIDLDEKFLKKIFKLTNKTVPESQEITYNVLNKQLDEIEAILLKRKVEIPNVQATSTPVDKALSAKSLYDDNEFDPSQKSILIIDDLGVITYQLGVAFKQSNYEVITSREIYDAIEKFKKHNFDLVLMDLFIPTEREGFILLEELRKITLNKPKQARIGIMSASAKKEHKQLCKMKGAEFYIAKMDDWQKELFKAIEDIIF